MSFHTLILTKRSGFFNQTLLPHLGIGFRRYTRFSSLGSSSLLATLQFLGFLLNRGSLFFIGFLTAHGLITLAPLHGVVDDDLKDESGDASAFSHS
ncbi:hypothetical protein ES703_112450 [subsurface metagenome]